MDDTYLLQDLLAPPGKKLEAMKRDRAGQHNSWINDQWRLCFVWKQPHAYDVGIADDH